MRRAGAPALLVAGVLLMPSLTACTVRFFDTEPASTTATPTTSPPVATGTPAPTPSSMGTPGSWSDIVEEISTGVVDIEAAGCEATGSGSGFIVGTDLVLTAAHVVEDSVSLFLRTDSGLSPARIIGFSAAQDLALLEATSALPGHVFTFAPEQPRVAEELAVLGYPQSGPLSFTRGTVSGHGREIAYDSGVTLTGVMQTDAAINPGNSGGPAISPDGRVHGVVTGIARDAEGIGYIIPAPTAAEYVERWRREPQTVAVPECGNDTGDDHSGDYGSFDDLPVLTLAASHPDTAELAQSLALHGWAINHSEWDTAWAMFTPALQRRLGGVDTWSAGISTAVWTDLEVLHVAETDTSREVDVALRTRQDATQGLNGQTCSDFRLRYTMVPEGGGWQIDAVQMPSGAQSSCDS